MSYRFNKLCCLKNCKSGKRKHYFSDVNIFPDYSAFNHQSHSKERVLFWNAINSVVISTVLICASNLQSAEEN